MRLIYYGRDNTELRLYPDINEVKDIAASGPTGLKELADSKKETINFINTVGPSLGGDILNGIIDAGVVAISIGTFGTMAAPLAAATAFVKPHLDPWQQSAKGENNISANDVAADYGVTAQKNNSLLGGVQNAAGGAINFLARTLNPLVSGDRHDWDSTKTGDILTGFDNGYAPIVQLAAKSLTNINTVVKEQNLINIEARQKDERKATQDRLASEAYMLATETKGSPEDWLRRLIAQVSPTVSDENRAAILEELNNMPPEERGELLTKIKVVANERVGDTTRLMVELAKARGQQ
jgi:hypothetical protein